MSDTQTDTQIYKLDKDYRLVTLKGKNCSVFLKNKNNQLVASLEGCQNDFATLNINNTTKELTDLEKRYLLSYIRAKKASISPDIAAELDVSVIKYLDGREEYLSENQLKKRIKKGIDFAKVSIGKISAHQLDIPSESKDCIYQFNNAEISKITVGENSKITLDLRDNEFIET
ncbi:MAG: hypothetical protein MJ210_02935, partial [Alphaproteobacteria bacterium]|nr:hypothetical protein [Alphaproteobacteria bacterium]